MKEIQGKIKFGIVPLRKDEKFGLVANDLDAYKSMTNNDMDSAVLLSEITEKQAAEFVEGFDQYWADYCSKSFNLLRTPKESLISLLKANDVRIKEWKQKPFRRWENEYGIYEVTDKDTIEYDNTPDDLLLIKL